MSNPYLKFKSIFREIVSDLSRVISESRVIGLGTGRTVSAFLEVLDEVGVLSGKCIVTSSIDTAIRVSELGYDVVDTLSVEFIDLYIDSADKVDVEGNMIKGGGAALTMEKVLTHNSRYRVFIVDEGKVVNKLCPDYEIPLDVVPNALRIVMNSLAREGFKVTIRSCNCKRGPAISDVYGAIIDVKPPANLCSDLEKLEKYLDSLPGVITSGLFYRPADRIYVINEKGYRKLLAIK